MQQQTSQWQTQQQAAEAAQRASQQQTLIGEEARDRREEEELGTAAFIAPQARQAPQLSQQEQFCTSTSPEALSGHELSCFLPRRRDGGGFAAKEEEVIGSRDFARAPAFQLEVLTRTEEKGGAGEALATPAAVCRCAARSLSAAAVSSPKEAVAGSTACVSGTPFFQRSRGGEDSCGSG